MYETSTRNSPVKYLVSRSGAFWRPLPLSQVKSPKANGAAGAAVSAWAAAGPAPAAASRVARARARTGSPSVVRRGGAVEGQVEEQDVDARLAEEAQRPPA